MNAIPTPSAPTLRDPTFADVSKVLREMEETVQVKADTLKHFLFLLLMLTIKSFENAFFFQLFLMAVYHHAVLMRFARKTKDLLYVSVTPVIKVTDTTAQVCITVKHVCY